MRLWNTPSVTIAFVNEIAPEHGRTSCSDENSNGNEYFNEFGDPRCVRCAFLHRLAKGSWPHKAAFKVTSMKAVKVEAVKVEEKRSDE